MLLWTIRLALILIFLLIYLIRGTRVWAIGLVTISIMVVLDALRSRGLLADLDFLGYVIGGGLAAGAFMGINGIYRTEREQDRISGFRPPNGASNSGAGSAENSGFDRQLLFEQIRDNLGSDDVLDLIYDLNLKENEIVNPGQMMPAIIMRLLDEAETSNQMTQLALSVERILTPMPKDHLPRAERLSAETPPHLLRQYLIQTFSVDELSELCNQLGLEWQDMGSDNRKSRIRRLLLHLQRRGRTEDLINLIRTESAPSATA